MRLLKNLMLMVQDFSEEEETLPISPTINCCLASMEQPITSMPCAHDIIAVLMLGMPLIFLLGMQEQMLMQTILPFME